MTARSPSRGERGIILIAVLLAVAIMAVMVVAAASLTRAGIGTEELEQRRLSSHLALRSGLESAKALILATPEDKRLMLDGVERSVDLGNGITATITLRDAAGFADLNRSDPKLIEAVARFAGLGKAANGLADRIAKLRKDAEPPSDGTPPAKAPAAKPPAPKAGTPGAGEASQPAGEEAKPPEVPIIFLSLDQLPDILGISAEDARMLESGLTVFNPTGAINPLAAPDQVLQAIPGFSEQDGSDIDAVKKAGKGADDARLQQLAQRLQGLVTTRAPSVFMVAVKLEGGPGVLPGTAARAVVRLVPQGKLPFGTLALEEE